MATWIAQFGSGQSSVDPERQEQVLFDGQVQVPPGKLYSLSFVTRSNYRNARVAGNIQAVGGTGNDIRVMVVKGQSVVYDSGKRRSVVLSVDFSEPGNYTLVFDNRFSLLSPKVVAGKISLVHWGVDAEKDAADQQADVKHSYQAARVIQKLYVTLKADERVWGTTQLFDLPAIQLNRERSINAIANWSTNTIRINWGLFDFTDKIGAKGDDVLAATLAHEMSHIFFRHPGYGSTSQGAKGLLDELRGVTALDRIQEKEADILGIRVACQAGFDPQGMLILMRELTELDNSAISFMKNHPSGIERYKYLQIEAANCQSFQTQKRENITESTSPVQTPESSPTATTDTSGGLPIWKLILDPSSHWNFRFNRSSKMDEQFLYAERAIPEERRELGDFDTVDVKKQGDGYVGAQRERITFKIGDTSPQGFHYKACRWDFAVELTSVTETRIEGRWEGYPHGSKIDPLTCERSGGRIWEDVAWFLDNVMP